MFALLYYVAIASLLQTALANPPLISCIIAKYKQDDIPISKNQALQNNQYYTMYIIIIYSVMTQQ